MTVPITSDLAGYTAFWTRVVIGVALLLSVTSSVHVWLLWRILKAVSR